MRRCDALLLQFDYAEWEKPYLTPEHRPILQRMLELHNIHGDGSDAWDERDFDDDDNPLHPFQIAVRAEQTKLAALAAPPQRKRIAAARKRSETKRSANL